MIYGNLLFVWLFAFLYGYTESSQMLVCQSLEGQDATNTNLQKIRQLEEGLAKLEAKLDDLIGNKTNEVDISDDGGKPIDVPQAYPKDCAEIYNAGQNQSGIYTVQVGSEIFNVSCDMQTAGGGWTVFLRRQNGAISFNRSWRRYTDGFGELDNEFWLGNKYLHKMTDSGHGFSKLRVDMRWLENYEGYAEYTGFKVGSERYRLHLEYGSYVGDVGDELYKQSGAMFSTGDNTFSIYCAKGGGGGFWYKDTCKDIVRLTAEYEADGRTYYDDVGIRWGAWPMNSAASLLFVEMKFRPENF